MQQSVLPDGELPVVALAQVGKYLGKKERIQLEAVCRAFQLGLRRSWASLREVDFAEFLKVHPAADCCFCQEDWDDADKRFCCHEFYKFGPKPSRKITNPPPVNFANEDSIQEIVSGVLSRTSSVNLRSVALAAPATAAFSQRRTLTFLRCLADADAPLNFPSNLQLLQLSGLDLTTKALASLEKLLGRVASSLQSLQLPRGLIPIRRDPGNLHNYDNDDGWPSVSEIKRKHRKLHRAAREKALEGILSRTLPRLRTFGFFFSSHSVMKLDFLKQKTELEGVHFGVHNFCRQFAPSWLPKSLLLKWLSVIRSLGLRKFWLRMTMAMIIYSMDWLHALFHEDCQLLENLQFLHLEMRHFVPMGSPEAPMVGIENEPFRMLSEFSFQSLKALSLALTTVLEESVRMLTERLVGLEALYFFKCKGIDDACVRVVGEKAHRLRIFGLHDFDDGRPAQLSLSALKELGTTLQLDRVYVSKRMLSEAERILSVAAEGDGPSYRGKFRVGWDSRGELLPEAYP